MSRNDPLGLFPESKAATEVATKSSGGGAGWVVVGVLMGVALLMGFQRMGGDWSFGHGDGGDKKEDVRPITDKAGYLIFVHERQAMTVDEANMLEVAKELSVANAGLEWRSIDDDLSQPEAVKIIDFAKSKGVSPPLVVFKSKSGELRRAAAWPKTKADLEKVIR